MLRGSGALWKRCALQCSFNPAPCPGIHWWHSPGAGEAKASSPSRGGARKCPAQAHTVKPLVKRWDVKGKAERDHKSNWTEARLSSLHGSSSWLSELPPWQLAGKMGTALPLQGPEQSRGEKKYRQGGLSGSELGLEGTGLSHLPAHFFLQNSDALLRSGGTQMWPRLEERGQATGFHAVLLSRPAAKDDWGASETHTWFCRITRLADLGATPPDFPSLIFMWCRFR